MATSTAAVSPKSDAHDTRRRVKAIIASSSGNLVEWYDFFIYASFSLYFAKQFFPDGDTTTQQLNSFVLFSLSYFIRPLGGWFFGRLADKRGRKHSMLVSVLMMCGGSFAFAILPTHAQVGVLAPILLALVRLVQGFSVGGEYAAAATYMSEIGLAGRRGFYASWQYVTLIGGQLLAVSVLLILQMFLTEQQLSAFGWRIPYFIGGLAAVVAIYLRKSLHETTTTESRQHKESGSLRGVFVTHSKAAWMVMGFTAAGSMSYYIFTTYMQVYLVNTAGMAKVLVTEIMTAALLVFMVIQPLFGSLSDKIGRRTCIRIFGAGMAIFTIPLLSALGGVQSPVAAFGLIVFAFVILSFYTAISGVIKAEMFPAHVRALGVGLPYAIANAAFGGSAPAVALKFKEQGHEIWFYWYAAFFCAICFVVAMIMPDPRTKGYLQGVSEVD